MPRWSLLTNVLSHLTIRQQIGLEKTIVKEIEKNQLTWYGHVQRMAEGRLPKIALKWMPKQKRAWGRPKKNWMEGIRRDMNERNLNEGQWEDGKQWSLGVRQCRKAFWNRYIYLYIHIHYHIYIHNIMYIIHTQHYMKLSFIAIHYLMGICSESQNLKNVLCTN